MQISGFCITRPNIKSSVKVSSSIGFAIFFSSPNNKFSCRKLFPTHLYYQEKNVILINFAKKKIDFSDKFSFSCFPIKTFSNQNPDFKQTLIFLALQLNIPRKTYPPAIKVVRLLESVWHFLSQTEFIFLASQLQPYSISREDRMSEQRPVAFSTSIKISFVLFCPHIFKSYKIFWSGIFMQIAKIFL